MTTDAISLPQVPFARNLAAKSMAFANGWLDLENHRGKAYAAKKADPDTYHKWATDSRTEHCHFSSVVGVNFEGRVSESNPPEYAIGWVADYDDDYDAEILERKIGRSPLPPTFVSRTKKDRLRCVWAFETPAQFAGDIELAREFFRQFALRVEAETFYTGLDRKSTEPTQIYDVGEAWDTVGDPVKSAVVGDVLFEAVKSNPRFKEPSEIPWDAISAEVDRKFGDKLVTDRGRPFEVGARCNVFWADGSNPTVGFIMEAGIYAHSLNRFCTWGEILGKAFLEKHRAETRESITRDWWLVDSTLYVVTPDGVMKRGRDWFNDHLHRYGIKKAEERAEFLNFISETKSVHGVGPVVFGDRPVAKVGPGIKVLNTSTVRLTKPEPGDFSRWTELLEHLFGEDAASRNHALRWVQCAYRSALDISRGGPGTKGLALFLCGPKMTGKSLFVSAVADVFGGAADPEDYFLGEVAFNEELYEKFIWNMDDPSGLTGGARQRRALTNRIKKAVAAEDHSVKAKGRKTSQTHWRGRIIASCNDDPDSIGAIPDRHGAAEDKCLILGTALEPLRWGLDRGKELRAQSPAFLYWLLEDWKPDPEWALAFLGEDGTGGRFGQFAYTTPRIAAALEDADLDNELLDFLRTQADEDEDLGGVIEMTCADMLRRFDGISNFYNSAQGLGLALKRLAIKHPDLVSSEARQRKQSRRHRVIGFSAGAEIEEADPF